MIIRFIRIPTVSIIIVPEYNDFCCCYRNLISNKSDIRKTIVYFAIITRRQWSLILDLD